MEYIQTWECGDCGKEYYRCEKMLRRMRKENAIFHLAKHRKTCTARVSVKAKDPDAKPVRNECICPACGEAKRADKIVSHCLSKHKDALINSMTADQLKRNRELKLPIIVGNTEDSRGKKIPVVWICLGCKKGSFIHTRFPDRDFNLTDRSLLRSHKDCIGSWEAHKAIFGECTKPPVMLPYECLKVVEPEEDEEPVKEGPKDLTGVALEAVEDNLKLREEVKKYEASATEPCVRLKDDFRIAIKQYLYGPEEPEEPEEDDEMVKSLFTIARKRHIRTTILDKRVSDYEEKIHKMEDILRVLFENEDVRNIVLRRRLLTKENRKVVAQSTDLIDYDSDEDY